MQYRTLGGLALAVSVFSSASVSAEDGIEAAPVVVTATRTAQTADESLSSVSVITREEIDKSGVNTLPDLLERERGISFARNGAFGQSASLFLRGTNSDHVLVLVDGVQLGSATLGTTAFQHLPLAQIERIEIVRGPRSSLYGSEAIGGVIQIFTREGQAGAPRLSASVLTGNKDTDEVEAAFSGGDEDTRYAVSAKSFDTDGISARNDGFPDDDANRNDSASFNLSQDFGDRLSWSIRGLTAEGLNEFDLCGPFPFSQDCKTDFKQQVLSSELNVDVTSIWSTRLTIGRSRDDTTNFTNGSFDSEFDTERDEFSWQNDITIGTRNLLTVGFDYQDDQVDSTSDFTETSRDNEAVFAQWQWTGDRTDLQASIRHDENEAFGTEDTGSIAAGYRFVDGPRLYASYGTAFKAPTFNDLFFPNIGTFVGNPDLDPEESRTFEVGLEGGRDWRWGVNAFRTNIDDIIVFSDPDGFLGPIPGTNINLDEAEITGLELSAAGTRGGWDLEANLTLLDTEADTDDLNDGNDLPRRPDSVFTFSLSREVGRFSFSGHFQHESERFDDAANTVRLDDFAVVDLRVDYQLNNNLVLTGLLENALDEEYQTVDNFNMLDRTLFVRLSYQP